MERGGGGGGGQPEVTDLVSECVNHLTLRANEA